MVIVLLIKALPLAVLQTVSVATFLEKMLYEASANADRTFSCCCSVTFKDFSWGNTS